MGQNEVCYLVFSLNIWNFVGNMKVKELKDLLDKVSEDIEVLVFHDGNVIYPDIEHTNFINDKSLYDEPVIEIGCGWK